MVVKILTIMSGICPEPSEELANGRYRLLVETVPQLSWTTDSEGRCDYLSPQWQTFTGRPTQELLGFGWLKLLHADDVARTLHAWEQALAGVAPYDLEYRICSQTGEYRWFRTRGVHLENGRWVGTCTDVHAGKEAQDRLRSLFDIEMASRDLVDPVEIIAATCSRLGKAMGVARCAYADVWDGDRFRIQQDFVARGTSLVGDYTLAAFGVHIANTLKNGQTLVINDINTEISETEPREVSSHLGIRSTICCPLIKDGALIALMAVHHEFPRRWSPDEMALVALVADRTWSAIERARTERDLRALNVQLEARIAERTERLQNAINELEGFTYSVAHDLRAPVRTMVSYAHILKEDFADDLPREAGESLVRISAAASKLGVLVDDLLTYARLGKRHLRRDSFDLSELLKSVVEVVQEEDPRPIELAEPLSCWVDADHEQVRLLLHNLVQNASKYRSGEVLHLKLVLQDGQIGLQDDGIGIEPQYAKKIFQPFERLHRDTEYPGTGIGLANVARIALRHGGEAWMTSEGPGKGSTFWFTLSPREPNTAAPHP